MIKNIAYSCITEPTINGLREEEIIRWIHNDLSVETFSYQFFEKESNKIANILADLGIKSGDVVSIFLPRAPILISSFFGTLKLHAISNVLFSTLGEEALFDRLENCEAKVIITKKSLAKKIISIKDKLPSLRVVLIVDIDDHSNEFELSLKKLLADSSEDFSYPIEIDENTPAFLQFTSGSTGKPKGALHVHGAIEDFKNSFSEIMQLKDGDLFWCTADPAWITGLVYGIIVPLSTSTKQIQFGGVYHAHSWLTILEREGVNIWYTAPTALRMLMQEDELTFKQYDLSGLKRMYSVGEPLNPEIYYWVKKIFNTEIYDTWFQSETGCIMIANRPGLNIKPGSMGIPRSGIEVLICDENIQTLPVGKQGLLCVRKDWGSMFRAYFRKEPAYNEKFVNGIYITGDLAKKDVDGYVWYISRADDVINSAGHLVGPFEVESALLEIEEIVDVAVIGVFDPILYQKIIAFLTLKNGINWSKELELKCRLYIQNKVSSTAIPAEFHLIDKIPKNQSGKILRRVLKASYEGTDLGDLSTME